MTRTFIQIALGIMIAVIGLVGQAAAEPNKIALLVGISDYFDKNLEDLSYAANDVITVGQRLKDLGFQTTVLSDRAANREAVNKAIDELLGTASTLESDAIVFLMFSGHGQQFEAIETDSRSGKKELKEVPYFCPRDAKPYDKARHAIEGKTAEQLADEFNLISLNQLTNDLERRSNSTRNLLIVDACRNNPGSGKTAGITKSTARNLPAGISILFSARSGQKSWESTDDKIRHGVMSHYLIEGLSGKARNRRDLVTWSRLVNYIREETEYAGWRIAGGPERKQNPHAIINSSQTIVLGEPQRDFQWLTERIYENGLRGFRDSLAASEPEKYRGLIQGLDLAHGIRGLADKPDELWFQLQARNLKSPDSMVKRIVDSYEAPGTLRAKTATMDQIGGPLRYRLELNNHRVLGVDVSPDGKYLAAGDLQGDVMLYDAKNMSLIRELSGHKEDVSSVRFTNDSRLLLVGDWDSQVKVFDVETGEERAEQSLSNLSKGVSAISISPDGQNAAASLTNTDLIIWRISTGKIVKKISTPSDCQNVRFSPTGQTLVAALKSGEFAIYQTSDWKLLTLSKAHEQYVSGLAFSPDGTSFFTGSGDGTIRQWDAFGKLVATFSGHESDVNALAVSPDGTILASHSGDRSIRYWEISTGRQVAAFTHALRWDAEMKFTPSGEYLVTGSSWGDRSVCVWDASFRGDVRQPKSYHISTVRGVEFVGNAGIVVSCSEDNSLNYWDRDAREVKKILYSKANFNDIDVAPDGMSIAAASDDKTIRVWSIPDGELLHKISTNANVECVSFSATGKSLAAGDSAGNIQVYKTHDYHVIQNVKAHTGVVKGVRFCPDNRTLASVGENGSVKLWDARYMTVKHEKAKPTETGGYRTEDGHTKSVYDVVFSSDATRMATSGGDYVCLWDVQKFQIIERMYIGDLSLSLEFSPDGKELYVASYDKTLRIYDGQTGRRKAAYEMDSILTEVSVTDRQVLLGDGDSRVHVLDR